MFVSGGVYLVSIFIAFWLGWTSKILRDKGFFRKLKEFFQWCRKKYKNWGTKSSDNSVE